jgi:hypothetical protein
MVGKSDDCPFINPVVQEKSAQTVVNQFWKSG